MTSIVGPFAGVEAEYRRERISSSIRNHRRAGRHLLPRPRKSKEQEPAIDWYAG
jgi:hypothetical protein